MSRIQSNANRDFYTIFDLWFTYLSVPKILLTRCFTRATTGVDKTDIYSFIHSFLLTSFTNISVWTRSIENNRHSIRLHENLQYFVGKVYPTNTSTKWNKVKVVWWLLITSSRQVSVERYLSDLHGSRIVILLGAVQVLRNQVKGGGEFKKVDNWLL